MNINDERNIPSAPHIINMEDRRKISLTGVNDVDSFDEQCVTVITQTGELTVRGENLKIGKLSTDTGEMSIEGKMEFPKELEAKRTKCVVYTRVMGYFRPVESFNLGKKGEHKERVFFVEKKVKKQSA